MLTSIGLYMFNVVCAGNIQNCLLQLASPLLFTLLLSSVTIIVVVQVLDL